MIGNSLSPKKRFKMQVFGVFLSLILIVVVCVFSLLANSENDKTISVCRVRGSGISSGAIITEDSLYEYKMYYKEFENAGTQKLSDGSKRALIVTWENRELVIGKRFASSYLYGNTNLMWTMTTTEQSKRHSYLYSMDGELLNIQMDTSDFGDMVVPGDKLNIRAYYTDTLYNLPTQEEYMLSDGNLGEGVSVQKSVKFFNEVTVLDMLNSNDESIYDIYYNFVSLSKAKQIELLNDTKFIESTIPKSILIQATAEEVDNYSMIQTKNPSYIMTLLPRTNSNVILETLSDADKIIKSRQK